LGDKEKAKKIFENVLILDPNNLTAKYYLKWKFYILIMMITYYV
jgi:hypothetical protein